MYNKNISDSIIYIGANDKTLDLFESQYPIPNGVSYNSYLILDEKIAVMDTVDARKVDEWLISLEKALAGRKPDYLIVQHMESDHSSGIKLFIEKYTDAKVVGSAKTFPMIDMFFDFKVKFERIVVAENDTLELGKHTLQFIMAPMVHWPEVMVSYERSEKVVFSADAFGKFSTLDIEEPWENEARRYYLNIVGKYGAQVQSLLKKLSTLDITQIAPLHGPILRDDISFYIEKYMIWSSYSPENDGIFIAYASIHGHTGIAAKKLASIFEEKGAKNIILFDLSRQDVSYAVENAFRYNKMILACATYDAGIFPPMESFLHHLKSKNFQNRKIGLMQNGSWAPMAAKHMTALLETMKNIVISDDIITIKGNYKDSDIEKMELFADNFMNL